MKVKINPDKDFVEEMKADIKKANGHCPCVPPHKHNEDTKCMCKNFREQTEAGYCHCGLYYKE
jgi:ferredoxin-thioredoxin reductase catalytic subunit